MIEADGLLRDILRVVCGFTMLLHIIDMDWCLCVPVLLSGKSDLCGFLSLNGYVVRPVERMDAVE